MYVNVNDHLTVDSLYTNHRKDCLMKINIRHMTNVINNQAQMINDRPRTSVLQKVSGKAWSNLRLRGEHKARRVGIEENVGQDR